MRNFWWAARSARFQLASPTTVKAASARPDFRHGSHWRSSTSTTHCGLKRDLIAHLGTLDFVNAGDNVVFLGSPGHRQNPPRDRYRDPCLPNRPPSTVRHGLRMGGATGRSHHAGRLQPEPEAANLFFQLVSSRYERASLVVTSNKPFGRRGESSATAS